MWIPELIVRSFWSLMSKMTSTSVTLPLQAHVTKPSVLLNNSWPPVGYRVELVRAWIKLINSKKKKLQTEWMRKWPHLVWHSIKPKVLIRMWSHFQCFRCAFGCYPHAHCSVLLYKAGLVTVILMLAAFLRMGFSLSMVIYFPGEACTVFGLEHQLYRCVLAPAPVCRQSMSQYVVLEIL